jgi:amino acid transporter
MCRSTPDTVAMEQASVDASAKSATSDPKLKAGAIGYVSNIVISVASVAPAYSLAATLGFIAAVPGLGFHSDAAIVVAFFPMLAIAISYYWLNRADPDCGTTFSWVTKAMGPFVGWQAGWAVVIADVLVMPSLADVAGNYTFQLFGITPTTAEVVAVGVVWIAIMTAVCYIGIELSARLQQGLLALELITLTVFAVVALIKVYVAGGPHSTHVSAGWFNPFGVGLGPLSGGILLAIFIYWGWDTGVSVNEETEDATESPGKSAVISNFVLVFIYLLVTTAVFAYGGLHSVIANQADVFAPLGKGVLGSGLDKILIIAVLASASASTQTTILPGARTTLSMGRIGAIPDSFATIQPRFLSPGFSTLFIGGLSGVVYVLFSIFSHNNLLGDAFTSLSITIAFYYGITGYACVVYYRKQLFDSFKNFMLLGVVPLAGGIFLTYIMIKAIVTYSAASANYSTATVFGIGSSIAIALITIVIGLVLSLVMWLYKPAFFKRPVEIADADVFEPGYVPVANTPVDEFGPA